MDLSKPGLAARHVPIVAPDSLHQEANRAAIDLDGSWFGHHRWRRFRARPSLPRELNGWGVLTHLERNWMLVRVQRDRRGRFTEYQRIGVSFRDEIPDDERFLERLWQHHETFKARGDGLHYLDPEEAKALFAGLKIDGE